MPADEPGGGHQIKVMISDDVAALWFKIARRSLEAKVNIAIGKTFPKGRCKGLPCVRELRLNRGETYSIFGLPTEKTLIVGSESQVLFRSKPMIPSSNDTDNILVQREGTIDFDVISTERVRLEMVQTFSDLTISS